MTTRDELTPLIEALLKETPVAVDGGEVMAGGARPPVWVDEEGWLFVALQTVMRDEEDQVVDVREQEVALGRFGDHPPGRWCDYVRGTLRAARAIVRAQGGLDAALPGDVFAYSRVLADRSWASAEGLAAVFEDEARLAGWTAELEAAAWQETLAPCGLAEQAEAVRALRRPSIRLVLEAIEGADAGAWGEDEADGEVDDEDEDVEEDDHEDDGDAAADGASRAGGSRVGGDPDLPPELPWPSVEGEPMVFVAQIDLRAIAGMPAAAELPDEGVLSFFYAPFPPEGWGLAHPVAVLHFADPAGLSRRPSPDPRARLRAFAIDFEAEVQMPSLESSYHFESLRPAAEVRAFYAALAGGDGGSPPVDPGALSALIVNESCCDFERPIHQLLGHPASVQGDPYLDVEMSAGGWEGWREGSEAAMAARERALGWRLLLQVDAYQDEALLLNQDGGFFYFFIPEEALAARAWSAVRGCLQCH